MKLLNVILQSLIVWDWYIHKNGAERAPEMVKKGAGQVFFNFLGTHPQKESLIDIREKRAQRISSLD